MEEGGEGNIIYVKTDQVFGRLRIQRCPQGREVSLIRFASVFNIGFIIKWQIIDRSLFYVF